MAMTFLVAAQLGMEVKENHVPPENPASSVKKLCAMFERE